MNWSTTWTDVDDIKFRPAPAQDEKEAKFVQKVKKRFTQCEDWEAQARLNFE
jgi:hypothetical protein